MSKSDSDLPKILQEAKEWEGVSHVIEDSGSSIGWIYCDGSVWRRQMNTLSDRCGISVKPLDEIYSTDMMITLHNYKND